MRHPLSFARQVLPQLSLVATLALYCHHGLAAPTWGEFQDDGCVQSHPPARQYSAILHGIPAGESWEQACSEAGATVAGVDFAAPSRCVNTTFNMWGEFDVPDTTCSANWAAPVGLDTFTHQDDGCQTSGTFAGKRKYASRLWNVTGISWEDACALTPMVLAGKTYSSPHRCVNEGTMGIWGEWYVADSRCENTLPSYNRGAEDSLKFSAPLSGYIDMHTHLMSHLGFGGVIFHGQPYGAADVALGHCPSGNDAAHSEGHSRVEDILSSDPADVIAAALGSATHEATGYSTFPNWPANNSYTHQTMYYQWIKRAYEGGMRAMVVLAVNGDFMFGATDNGLPEIIKGLSIASNPIYTLDDMATLRRQTEAVYNMQDWVDELHGGPGKGWFRVVTEPEQAQAVIAAGKLAIILGTEVDYLFNCTPESCSSEKIAAGINEIHALGIRYVFPIHLKTNGFGGAALYNIIAGGEKYDCKHYGQDCNQLGLTTLGSELIQALMTAGMIIDVGHMSALAMEQTLTLAEQHHYPGIVTGHTGVYDMANGANRHEANPRGRDLKRIVELGGMVGLIPGQGNLDNVAEWHNPGGGYIAHHCGGTSQTFAQVYQYLMQLFGDAAYDGRISLGTDFNGFAHMPGGRFGAKACEGGSSGASQPLGSQISYPFAVDSQLINAATVTGTKSFPAPYLFAHRTFDFNTEGAAHIGMMPEFFEDLRQQGLKRSDLEPIFRSAGYFTELWQNAQKF